MSHPAAKSKGAKPYTETTAPPWSEDQGSWEVTGPSSWRKRTTCPRCEHVFTAEYALIFKSVWPDRGTPSPQLIDVRCQCATPHPPHAGGEGCGWYGQLLFSP